MRASRKDRRSMNKRYKNMRDRRPKYSKESKNLMNS
jgi:hypothetical protein